MDEEFFISKHYQSPFKVGRLRGDWVVTFTNAEGKRSRFKLDAATEGEANIRAYERWKKYWDEYSSKKKFRVATLWTLYLESLEGRPAGKKMASESGAILPFFGELYPADINDELVDKYIKTRFNRKSGKAISDGTLWTELGRLRDALRYAVKKKRLSKDDLPFIKIPGKPAPKDRYLNDQEIGNLLKAAQHVPHLYIAIHLMLATAGRISAVLELEWDRVDFERGTVNLIVVNDKGKKGRACVPMTRALRVILLEAKGFARCSHVVEWNGKPIDSIKTAFNDAVKRAELKDVTPHIMRHTAAVRMAEAGCEMRRIAAYLGHTDVRTTERIYAKFHPEHLKKEADAVDLSNHIDEREPLAKPAGKRTPKK